MTGALVLACSLTADAAPRAPAAPAASGKAPEHAKEAGVAATANRQRQLQAEQRELKTKLAQLRKSLAAAESAHSEAADALAASETAISAANRHLQQLAVQKRQVEQRIAELQAAQAQAAAAQDQHASRLALTLQSQWILLQESQMQEVVDPLQWQSDQAAGAQIDRAVRERMHRIGELHDRRTELASLENESRQRGAELAHIDADERTSRGQLLHQEAVRRATLARIAHDVSEQRKSVANLERDATRLTTLIDQIGQVLAEQARRRAAARAKAQSANVAPVPERPPPAAAATNFGRQRGKLVLPVQGRIASRYGAARLGEDGQPQPGAPAWKGLFIHAQEGSPVHAIAAGQVVFAEWLRGFGNLMILDHGEGFLSVYANNESLLRGVGDEVAADDVIASVGNTGGNPQSGLYFEMRYQGRPFDPLAWAVAR